MRRSCAAILGLAAGFLASVAPASAFSPETCTLRRDDGSVLSARLFRPDFAFSQPTRDYAHAVLGDDEEYRGLKVTGFPASRSMMPPEGVDISPMLPESVLEVTLPDTHVFEDIAPRPFDWTGAAFHRLSGVPPLGLNVTVVETDMAQGATLAVYKVTCAGMKKVAATEPIGQSHRWLAPAGIADFDGNGQNDIAYVETPHLAGVLKIVTLAENRLVSIAEPQEGFSNHRIGDDYIVSAVRDCGDGLPELILPDLGWTGLRAVGVENGALRSRAIPGEPSAEGVALAARCG